MVRPQRDYIICCSNKFECVRNRQQDAMGDRPTVSPNDVTPVVLTLDNVQESVCI